MNLRRGFTLIELLISMAIMLIAVAMASALLVAGTNISRTADEKIGEADDARMALDHIVRDVLLAADGAPGGIYLNYPSGTTKLYSAIFGMDGTSGNGGTAAIGDSTGRWNTDDLWLIVPNQNAMREGCITGSSAGDTGAATTVLAQGTGVITVRCTDAFHTWDTLEATNMVNAALLSPPLTLTAAQAGPPYVPGTIGYAEQAVANYSDAPQRGGFQVGDQVFPVSVLHYYVRQDSSGVPGLYVAKGAIGGTEPSGAYPDGPYPVSGRPFADFDPSANGGTGAADPGTLVQRNVEDLEIAYGFDLSNPPSGDPAKFTWKNGMSAALGATAATSTPLRAIRISVVVRSADKAINNNDDLILSADTQPQQVENHYLAPDPAPPAADGYRRVIYTRIVDLPNLAPGSL